MRVDLAIQSDGKIVVLGTMYELGQTADFGIVRFEADGSIDPSFGTGGKTLVDVIGNEVAASVAIQTDGKIVVTGTAWGNGTVDFAVARLNSNGIPDATFGVGGKTTIDFSGQLGFANDVALQADGRIVIAGMILTPGVGTDFGLVRLDTSGQLDAAFGSAGKVTTVFSEPSSGNAIVIQPTDGKIIVGGHVGYSANTTDFALARYETNGDLDPAFGVGGMVRTDFAGAPDSARDVEIQSDGRIVAAGITCPDLADIEIGIDWGVARYETNGAADASFGSGGKVTTDFGTTDFAEGIVIQPDCQIVVAGYAWPISDGNSDFALARYKSSGCIVEPPAAACPLSHGHWKSSPSLWPVDSLVLGNKTYSKPELLAIMGSPSQTDASLTLARQLIAAKLNVIAGSDPTPVAGTIWSADAVLSTYSGKLAYKVKSSSANGQLMTAYTVLLTTYNNGSLTPGCTY